MSCAAWEERIARWVDGEPVTGVEAHVAECAGCRELAGALRADQAMLREAVDVPAWAVAQVRARVEKPRRIQWWWTPAVAMAGFALIWGVGAWRTLRQPLPEKLAPPPAIVAEKVDRIPRWVEPVRSKAPRRETVTTVQIQALRELFDDAERRARQALEPPRSEVAMRITTANPDVVIVWLQESKGESQ